MHYQNPPVKPSEPPRTLAVELQAHSIESSSGASVGRHGTIAEASLSKEIDTCEKEGRRVQRVAGWTAAAVAPNSAEEPSGEPRRIAALRAAGLAPSPYTAHQSAESRRLHFMNTPSSLRTSEEL